MRLWAAGLVFGLSFGSLYAGPVLRQPGDGGSKASVAASSETLTFQQCFELALQRSETLQIKQEDLAQAQAYYRQIRGSVLPNLKFNATHLIQDRPDSDDGEATSLNKRERTDSKFVVTQPLFKGFKEFYALNASKAEQRRQKLLYRQASLNLYADVAEVFYLAVQNETLLQNLTTLHNLTKDRVKELTDRVDLGKSRRSEVLSSDSQSDSIQAQIEGTKGKIRASRDLLAFFTGRDMRSVALVDEVPPAGAVESEEQALSRADNRTDILALKEEAEVQRYGVRVARAGYWPLLNVTGNYYTKRTGFQDDIDWDVLFNLDVPIYQGGGIKALVEQSKSQYRQAQLNLTQAQRRARADISQAHSALLASMSRAGSLKNAYEKARRSYDLLVKEYRLGLVNNLEVLQAMNTMQQLKEDYDDAIIQGKLNTISLRIATENL